MRERPKGGSAERRDARGPAHAGDTRGFALALVVFLLFAIGIAGTTAYQVLRTEASMSLTSQQGSLALSAASAGLERFMATEFGPLPPERTYNIAGARAVVVPRRMTAGPYPDHTYLITSIGTFIDPRFPGNAAERTVARLAVRRRVPIELLGALVSPSDSIVLDDVTDIDGNDSASGALCPEAGVRDLPGVVGGGTIDVQGGSGLSGSPVAVVDSVGTAALLENLDVAWDVLTDAGLPVDYVNPDPSDITTDPYTSIRFTGDRSVNCFDSGEGLLIVAGELNIIGNPVLSLLCSFFGMPDEFSWDGLILTGSMPAVTEGDFTINGALVVGLDGSGDSFRIEDGGTIRFNSCNTIRAGEGVSHLRPVEGTWWEVY